MRFARTSAGLLCARGLLYGLLASLSLSCSAASVPASEVERFPFEGVRYVHRHVSEPREIDMHIVIINLKTPGLTFRTTGANGAKAGETDLETTRRFVQRSKAQIGINGGFFTRTPRERLLGICDLCSLAVSDGVVVSKWGQNQYHAVNISADNVVTFVERAANDATGIETKPPVALFNAIAGNVRLIRDGAILARGGDPTYPQTAIGHTADRRLILFVSDGRQPAFSAGMTYEEVATVLKEFGAVDAIALDGGGSATLVMADERGEPRVLNRPSDGSERAVGNNLAVRFDQKSGD